MEQTNMNTQHTPGPWRVWSSGIVGNTGHYEFKVESDSGYSIASGTISCLGRTYPELEANAQLIATAPDLLKACRDIWQALDEWATERTPDLEEIASLREQAKAAIAKAAIAKATGGAK